MPNSTKAPNELSGFGFPENPTAVELCDRDSCYQHTKPLISDLYCRLHGRFLPLIKAPTAIRVLVAIVFSLAIYGSLEYTTEYNSSLPIYAVYATISLGLLVLPLRHYPRTATVATIIWLTASAIPIIWRDTDGQVRVLGLAIVAGGGIAILMIYATAGAPRAKLPTSLSKDVRVISRTVAVMLIISIWAAAATLALRSEGYVLPGDEQPVARITLITALASLASGLLTISASSIVIGVRKVRWQVWAIGRPNRPRWISPRLLNSVPRPYRSRNAVEHTAEVITRVIYQAAVSLANAFIVVGRVTSNCLAFAIYSFVYAIVTLINVLVRTAVVTARWLQATAASFARLIFYSLVVVYRSVFDTIASIFVPVAALFAAPWFLLAMTNATRLYLRQAHPKALWNFAIFGAATTVLLFCSWVILANQHPRDSFISFGRSASVTSAYGIILILTGGWLLGTPGALGYGHIHFGIITYTSTGLAAIALLFYEVSRRRQGSKSTANSDQPAAASSASAGSGRGGRGWTVAMALVLIASAIAALSISEPWKALSISRPSGLIIESYDQTSVLIGWGPPQSGPVPTEYIIMQNGSIMGTVPGAVRSYRFIGLEPDTSYSYQIIAIRGKSHSPRSALLTAKTRVPHIWTANMTGLWMVHYSSLKWRGMTFNNGSPGLTTNNWMFTQNCDTSSCPVTVDGALAGSSFTALLQRSGSTYSGSGTNTSFLSCGSQDETSHLEFTIRVLRGEVLGGRWLASSWSGSLTLSVPAAKCTAAELTAVITATR